MPLPEVLTAGAGQHLAHHQEIHKLLNKLVFNVTDPDYGALGNDVANDRAAIMAADAAAAAAGGGVVYFPPGKYRIGQELYPSRNNTWLMLQEPPRWPYALGLAPTSYIKPLASYTGTAIIRLRDMVEGGYPAEQGNIGLIGLCLDGSAVGGTVNGISATGLVKAVKIRGVTIRLCGGAGVKTGVYNRAGTNLYPRGWELDRVVANACTGSGFDLTLMTDAVIRDCLSVGNGVDGYALNGPGETKLIGCFAPFNGAKGYRVVGETGGNVNFVGCSSDRNQQDGFYVGGVTGPGGVTPAGGAIVFDNCAAGRDGKNNNLGGGNWAAFALNNTAVPVIYVGCTSHPGVEDDGSGVQSPQYALRVLHLAGSNPKAHIIGGYWWGATGTLLNSGNARIRIDPTAEAATGAATVSPTVDNTFGGFFAGRT